MSFHSEGKIISIFHKIQNGTFNVTSFCNRLSSAVYKNSFLLFAGPSLIAESSIFLIKLTCKSMCNTNNNNNNK